MSDYTDEELDVSKYQKPPTHPVELEFLCMLFSNELNSNSDFLTESISEYERADIRDILNIIDEGGSTLYDDLIASPKFRRIVLQWFENIKSSAVYVLENDRI